MISDSVVPVKKKYLKHLIDKTKNLDDRDADNIAENFILREKIKILENVVARKNIFAKHNNNPYYDRDKNKFIYDFP